MGELMVAAFKMLQGMPAITLVVVIGLLVLFIAYTLRNRQVDVESVTSIGRLQTEQITSMLSQMRSLSEQLNDARKQLAEIHEQNAELRDRVLELEDLLRDYKNNCDDCPTRPALAG